MLLPSFPLPPCDPSGPASLWHAKHAASTIRPVTMPNCRFLVRIFFGPPSPLTVCPNAQLSQLLGIDAAGSAGHQVGGPLRLGEGDAIADAVQSGEEHHQAVDPQGDAAVRRGAVLQGLQEEAEPLLGLLGVDPQE